MALIDFTGFENQQNNTFPNYFFTSYGSTLESYFDYTTDTRLNYGRALNINVATSIYMYKVLGVSYSSLICGFAFKFITASTGPYLRFCFGNADDVSQITVHVSTDGVISMYRGFASYLIYSSSILFDPFVWNYFEIKAILHNTAGSCVVHVNNTEAFNLTNIDTLYAGSTESINNVYVRMNAITGSMDDFYVLDETGSNNNTFLGDVMVESLVPTANGTTNDGTASAGSNYECVDDLPYSDTDYVTLDAINEIELYTIDDLQSTSYTKTIYGVKSNFRASKDSTGSRSVSPILRVNASNYVHPGDAISLGYGYMYNKTSFIWELNPDDSAAWEESDVNAMEAGIKVTV